MFWIAFQFVGAACLGFLGGEAGRVVHNNSTNSVTRHELTTALRYRALVLGAIIGGGPVMMFTLGNDGQLSRAFSIACLGAALAFTLPVAVVWLHLVTTYGQKDIESGEIVLILAILPFAFLYVCGILWITLGSVLVLAGVGCGGLYFYRILARARAR